MFTYSIIIPHQNSLETLPRLFQSIPHRKDIEIILVDNSALPMKREEIGVDRDYILLHAESAKFAGGARNVGLQKAKGHWILFADADDFFTPNAFDVFDLYKDSKYDLIYFKPNSVYDDTLEYSDRSIMFSSIIDRFIAGESDLTRTKLSYTVPWGKLIRRNLLIDNQIRFDEVVAANDVYFSTLVAYYSAHFTAVNQEVYTVTVRKGSLSRRRDYDVIHSRFLVFLRRNKFLREKGLGKYQVSVLYYIYNARKFGVKKVLQFLYEALKYRQNIFVGHKNWYSTFKKTKREDSRDEKYITK